MWTFALVALVAVVLTHQTTSMQVTLYQNTRECEAGTEWSPFVPTLPLHTNTLGTRFLALYLGPVSVLDTPRSTCTCLCCNTGSGCAAQWVGWHNVSSINNNCGMCTASFCSLRHPSQCPVSTSLGVSLANCQPIVQTGPFLKSVCFVLFDVFAGVVSGFIHRMLCTQATVDSTCFYPAATSTLPLQTNVLYAISSSCGHPGLSASTWSAAYASAMVPAGGVGPFPACPVLGGGNPRQITGTGVGCFAGFPGASDSFSVDCGVECSGQPTHLLAGRWILDSGPLAIHGGCNATRCCCVHSITIRASGPGFEPGCTMTASATLSGGPPCGGVTEILSVHMFGVSSDFISTLIVPPLGLRFAVQWQAGVGLRFMNMDHPQCVFTVLASSAADPAEQHLLVTVCLTLLCCMLVPRLF